MRKANKRVLFGYGVNYLIDVEHAMIVEIEAPSARSYEACLGTAQRSDCDTALRRPTLREEKEQCPRSP